MQQDLSAGRTGESQGRIAVFLTSSKDCQIESSSSRILNPFQTWVASFTSHLKAELLVMDHVSVKCSPVILSSSPSTVLMYGSSKILKFHPLRNIIRSGLIPPLTLVAVFTSSLVTVGVTGCVSVSVETRPRS